MAPVYCDLVLFSDDVPLRCAAPNVGRGRVYFTALTLLSLGPPAELIIPGRYERS